MKTRKNNKRAKKQIGGVLEENVCPICTEDLRETSISTTKCNHSFHTKCIEKWCNTRKTGYIIGCPVCRRNIKPLCLQISKNDRLFDAINSENIQDIMDTLVSADINNENRGTARLPLVQACVNTNFEIVNLLIDFGADINKGNPLHQAIYDSEESTRIAKLLIEKGADIHAIDDHEDPPSPLTQAVYLNNYDIVELLLEKGADVNSQDRYGWSPLMLTMLDREPGQENLEIVKLLLKQPNINIDLKTNNEADEDPYRTALDIANQAGFTEISKLLKPIMEARLKEVIKEGKTKDGQPLIQRAHPEVTKYVGDYLGGKSNRKTHKNRKTRKNHKR